MSIEAPSLERAVRPLAWIERGDATKRWWETRSDDGQRRAVVIWLRDLSRVAWWIHEGERTLALGYVESVEPPGDAVIAKAQRAAAQRWWEIYA